MEAIGSVASIVAVATLAAQITKLCAVYVTGVRNASQDAHSLHQSLEATELVLKRFSLVVNQKPDLLKNSRAAVDAIGTCDADLRDLKTCLEQHLPSRTQRKLSSIGLRSLKWPLSEALVCNRIDRMDRCRDVLKFAMQLDLVEINIGMTNNITATNRELGVQRLRFDRMSTTLVTMETNVSQTSTDVRQVSAALDLGRRTDLLRTLNHIPDAAFNAASRSREPFCSKGTRKAIMDQILQWADEEQSEPIFWLSGMAGTGKSTIARTVASTLLEKNRLGGSFFFSRGRGDLAHSQRLFAFLAFQLAHKFEAIDNEICDAINAEPTIGEQTVRDQYLKLFYQPLRRCQSFYPKAMLPIIIIDALDECADHEEVEALLVEHFGGTRPLCDLPVKIVLTSRPEQFIHTAFRTLLQPTTLAISLQEIASSVVQGDIESYFKVELVRIRDNQKFENEWPGADIIQRLVTVSDGLFIFAATICRFIHNASRSYARELPSMRLSHHGIQKISLDPIDAMYKIILEHCLRGYSIEGEAVAVQRFRMVVGGLVVLKEELELSSLAEILFPDLDNRIDVVCDVLDPLASIIRVVNGEPVRILHQTFRDFLLDDKRCIDARFQINELASHALLQNATYH